MLSNSITGFVDTIIANVDGFTANNCKGFDDESAIDYILRNDLSPNPQACCIVSYGGIGRVEQMSEFGGRLIAWILVLSALYPLTGDETDEKAQRANAYAMIDDIVSMTINHSTLGGAVMDIDILDAEPLMEYVRNGANTFLLLSMRFKVLENL